MQSTESFKWLNISATSAPSSPIGSGNLNSSPPSFRAVGGNYQLDIIGTTIGSVQLSVVGPDGSTLLAKGAAVTTASSTVVQLAQGSYVLALAGSTNVSANLTRIPV